MIPEAIAEVAAWKRRAEAAEAELVALREKVRQLLAECARRRKEALRFTSDEAEAEADNFGHVIATAETLGLTDTEAP